MQAWPRSSEKCQQGASSTCSARLSPQTTWLLTALTTHSLPHLATGVYMHVLCNVNCWIQKVRCVDWPYIDLVMLTMLPLLGDWYCVCCDSNALQAIHVEIVNLKDTCQSDYLRSSSGFPDSTSRGSYLDISNTHRWVLSAHRTLVNLTITTTMLCLVFVCCACGGKERLNWYQRWCCRSLFISKDGILNTVQAVSHMSSDMCQRLEVSG